MRGAPAVAGFPQIDNCIARYGVMQTGVRGNPEEGEHETERVRKAIEF